VKNGPCAVIECPQEIPCNPCEPACPRGAITVGTPITNVPVLDASKCTGCGQCIAACPGLAIFVVNHSHSGSEATVAFPYEYLPLPRVGDIVRGVDRTGTPRCDARVVSVVSPPRYDHTAVITVAAPKDLACEIRSIARLRGGAGGGR
jgi:Fe-S-cluster-containing hydrogenase component 2